MEKTSKLNRFIGVLMLIIGSAAVVNNIGCLPYFEDYFYTTTWTYEKGEEKVVNENGWVIVLWFVGAALVVLGIIMLIRGIISVIKDKASGHIFTIVLGACGAALYGYELGYETYNFIDYIRSDDWDMWQDDTEKTQYMLNNYMWISVFAILAAVSILLMVFAIISMKKSNAAGYQNGGFGAYQAPAYEQAPTYMQTPIYDQNTNVDQYADENAYQQKTCKNCGNVVQGKFCTRCGTPMND